LPGEKNLCLFFGCQYDFSRRLLALGNDVEPNPGPGIEIRSYNTRGMKDYEKTKRILNYLNRSLKTELGITFLQETHLGLKDDWRLNTMWRGSQVCSPAGDNSARGCMILYAPWQFDQVVVEKGDEDGRTAWLVARKGTEVQLFIGIYGPNRRQDLYFKHILDQARKMIDEHQVTQITFGGDLNIEIVNTAGRHATTSERKAKAMVKEFLKDHNMVIVSDTKSHTWGNKKSRSTIDYIATNIAGKWKGRNAWGIDNSDHAMVEVVCLGEVARGPGLPRIDPAFLDNPSLKEMFRSNLVRLMGEAPKDWDPHMRLEYLKTCIRSESFLAVRTHEEGSRCQAQGT